MVRTRVKVDSCIGRLHQIAFTCCTDEERRALQCPKLAAAEANEKLRAGLGRVAALQDPSAAALGQLIDVVRRQAPGTGLPERGVVPADSATATGHSEAHVQVGLSRSNLREDTVKNLLAVCILIESQVD